MSGINHAGLVFAGAQFIAEREGTPLRWLKKLEKVFATPALLSDPSAIFSGPWQEKLRTDPSALGGLLLEVRTNQHLQQKRPKGVRHGRVSEPSVYTPMVLAREMTSKFSEEDLMGRVVDPACGAGAFLIAVFERRVKLIAKNSERPSAAECDRALLGLSGIDVDAEALALAEFSLRVAAFRACGAPADVPQDLRQQDALEPLTDLEGHADLVVGNPPYVEGRGLSEARLEELRARYRCAERGKVNLCAVFTERGLELLKPGGTLYFILPATLARNERYAGLRGVLLEQTLEELRPLPKDTFPDHAVETLLLRVQRKKPDAHASVQLAATSVPQSQLALGPLRRFGLNLNIETLTRLEQMEKTGVPLGELFEVRDGISTGFQPFPKQLLGRVDGKMFVAEDGSPQPFDPTLHKRIIDGQEFHTFTPVRWNGRYIHYDKHIEHDPPHPGKPFNCQLRSPELYDRSEKLLSRQTAKGLIVTLDRERFFVRNSVHVIFAKEAAEKLGEVGLFDTPASTPFENISLAALCACLNSALYNEYHLAVTGEDGAVFPQVHIADLKRLPVIPSALEKEGVLDRLGLELLELHALPLPPAEKIAAIKARVERELHAVFAL